MQSVSQIWTRFKNLKWYYKILVFLPFFIAILFSFLSFFKEEKMSNQVILDSLKEKTDSEIKTYSKNETIEKDIRETIDQEREVVSIRKEKRIKEIEREIDELDKTIESINSINDASELITMLTELRKRGQS